MCCFFFNGTATTEIYTLSLTTLFRSGETTIETQGFAGRECLEASRFLETALGSKTSDRLTAEFYQTQHQTNNNHLPLNSSQTRNRP